jgi:hypothetical protein
LVRASSNDGRAACASRRRALHACAQLETRVWDVDDCDDWTVVGDVDREVAITCVIDWIIANPVDAEAVGVDPKLIEDLWR